MAIRFTDSELELLEMMTESWQEGMGPARQQTIDDPTIGDVDVLLELTSGIDRMDADVKSIERKVRREQRKWWRRSR